jgi:hypothetical protein
MEELNDTVQNVNPEAAIEVSPAQPKRPSPINVLLKCLKYLVIFSLLFLFLYLVFKIITYLPFGTTSSSEIKDINYTKVGSREYQRVRSLEIPQETIISLPQVQVIEFGRDLETDRIYSFLSILSTLFPFEVDKGPMEAPAYEYAIQDSTFVLNPKIACDSRKIKLIFLDDHINKIYLLSDLPQEYKHPQFNGDINVILNKINPDGSLNIRFNDQPLTLLPGKEFIRTNQNKAIIGKDIESWYIRNINNARVKCL